MVAGFVARVFIVVSDTGSIKGTIRNQRVNGDGSKKRPLIDLTFSVFIYQIESIALHVAQVYRYRVREEIRIIK